ncbi:MAG: hypothetical protein JXR12_01540 [Neptunomonas phycophila]|uniref:hypothetical protein n=1 Tax=Neptunomonas phycophila TaxID=1572645 RepID=UPI003B8ADF6E
MAIIKSPLLDGLSGIPELTVFFENAPNFRQHVVVNRDTIDVVIEKLYEASHCHHAFPKNWDELDTDDYEFQDFLHTVLTVANTKLERIEAVFGENY